MIIILKGGRTIKNVLSLHNVTNSFEILCEDGSKELVTSSEIFSIL